MTSISENEMNILDWLTDWLFIRIFFFPAVISGQFLDFFSVMFATILLGNGAYIVSAESSLPGR